MSRQDTKRALEADFRQYYGTDISWIWAGHRRMDIFTMARLMAQLPRDGRLFRLASGDELSFQEHMLLGQLDLLRHSAYFTMINAQAQVDAKAWAKVVKGAPKPTPRPGKKDDSAGTEEKKSQAVYTHPRDAHVAVSRMIHVKAMKQTGMI